MNMGRKRKDAPVRAAAILIILSLALASAAYGGADGHARPPKGFSWKRFDGIQALLLVPRGWHVKAEKKSKDERSVFITKDKIGKEGGFSTGLVLNAIRDAPSKFGVPPSAFGKALLIEMMQGGRESREVGPSPDDRHFKGYKGFFRVGSEPEEKKVQYVIALGNDATGTFYMITFESPEAEWDEAWKTGSVILNNLGLDEKY